MISFSIAIDPNKGIGINGQLPWHIKEELQLFKANTLHKNIIMGQTTYDNLPRKLVDRNMYVVSNDPNYKLDEGIVINDLIAFLQQHQNDETEYIVCGGASIYKQAYPYFQKGYISFIKNGYEVDTYFDIFNEDDWIIDKQVEYDEFIYQELSRKQG